ncbi:MAG TPA: SDR family oxidoreductase [Thermomicrobiales bacterium]|nr:SDR family oxidoreductase [Thermomicrobiales bacterium]
MQNIGEMFSLEGKIAAVIGGTGVLGGEFCRALAGAGAAVAILGRSEARAQALAEEMRAAGQTCFPVPLDATNKEQLVGAYESIENVLGDVDILVNASGVNSTTPFLEIEEAEWQQILDTNLRTTFLACQVFGEKMIDTGRGGSIINISSASSGPPLSKVFVYGVSKAGLNNLTQYLAREFAPYGVRVNAIAPGFFPAEQNRKILSRDRVDAILGHTPMKRLGNPSELAGTLIWLASEHASGFVTGAIVRVDGGFSAMTI